MATILNGQFEYPGSRVPMGISHEQQQQNKALLCQIRPKSDLTFEVTLARAAGTSQVVRLPARIIERQRVAEDVCRLILKLPRSQPLSFLPGQHIKILLDRGKSRCYSIASAESDNKILELHVRRVDQGLFSDIAFHQENSLLRLEGPLGLFNLRDETQNIIMIAGGTGFAPFKSMLSHLLPLSKRGHVNLIWGGRNHQDIYDLDWLLQQQRMYQDFDVEFAIEKIDNKMVGGAENAENKESQNCDWFHGRVHELALKRLDQFNTSDVYAAGPPPMITALREGVTRRGFDATKIICDVFDYA